MILKQYVTTEPISHFKHLILCKLKLGREAMNSLRSFQKLLSGVKAVVKNVRIKPFVNLPRIKSINQINGLLASKLSSSEVA